MDNLFTFPDQIKGQMAMDTDPATEFALKIELGNDAMQDPYDVAQALRKLADQMSADDYPESGIIRDENGNTVGRYTVK